MAKPTVRVRIGFTDGPYVNTVSWTDVTSYVRSISTNRGRSDDWQNFDTGNATVVLDNRDRRFDPTYSGGPYYGNLQPRRQILVDATVDNVNYYGVFRGFIDGWPVSLTDAGYDSTVTISCYDVLGLITQEQCPFDWSDKYIRSLNPSRYWKLDDTINPADVPTTAGTLTNLKLKDYGSDGVALSPKSASTPTSNRDSLAPGISNTAISWAQSFRFTTHPYDTSLAYTSLAGGGSIWFMGEATNLLWSENAVYNNATELVITEALLVNSTSTLQITSYSSSTGRYDYTATTAVTPGTPHHFAFRWSGAGSTSTLTAYIDGVEIPLTRAFVAGSMFDYGRGYQFWGMAGQQFVAWRNTTPTAAQLQTIYKLGNNVQTETTADRFSRIIAETSLPGAFYSVTASPAGTVANLTVGGAFIGNELQLTSDSEGGELYTSRDGVLTMTNRTYYQATTSATSQATFGSGGIPIQPEIDYYWTADGIRNRLDINWTGDANVTLSDATSIAAYGTSSDTVTTVLSTYNDAYNLGTILLGFGKLPRLIMSAVQVGQALTTAQWVTVLGLELLNRITVVVPEPVGSNLSQTQLIQEIRHDITPGDWKTTILGSSRWSSVFTIGTSYLDGTDILG